MYLEALARLTAGHEGEGNHEKALAAALRLLDHDPLREDAHQAAMRAYCRLGRRNAALGQYDRCREVMLEELGVEPMAETTELYQAILENRFEAGRLPGAIPVEGPVPSLVEGPVPSLVEGPEAEPPVHAGRSPLDVVASSPLVGREQELASLRGCWREAQATRGKLVLVSGEAGVGKSRLIEEFADRLRWQGVRVLWGRCYEFERVLPYQPVAEALRAALPTLGSDELADFPRWAIAEVVRLVPEMGALKASQAARKMPLGRRLRAAVYRVEGPVPSQAEGPVPSGVEGEPGVQVPAAPGLDQERARLFEGVTCFLAGLASQGALLVVLEDLHWATDSTLQLVHYLAHRLADRQVLVVGTFRPEATGIGHPLLTLRRRLTRQGLGKRWCRWRGGCTRRRRATPSS